MEIKTEKLTLIVDIPNVSKRLMDVFSNCGIDYIEQLSSYTERDIMHLRGVGVNLYMEIKSLMSEYGVSFMGSSLKELSKNKIVFSNVKFVSFSYFSFLKEESLLFFSSLSSTSENKLEISCFILTSSVIHFGAM